MKPERLIELMAQLEKLKCAERHSWTTSGRRESVAEHCWRLALSAYFVKDDFPDVDISKVILMCLCHDFGEIFTGDIPAFDKTDVHEKVEKEATDRFVKSLPPPFDGELTALFSEMEAGETTEAKLANALDKLEALFQHNEADISTWLPLEYELNFTYGADASAFSDVTEAIRQTVTGAMRDKIDKDKDQNT